MKDVRIIMKRQQNFCMNGKKNIMEVQDCECSK